MALTALWTRLTSGIAGLAIGGAASRAFAPIFELLSQESWHANPFRVLGLQQLAELVAEGAVDFDAAAEHAQRSGYDANKLRALVELALVGPDLALAIDMRQREFITEEQFTHALRKMHVEPEFDEGIHQMVGTFPSVTDMVRFALREVYDPAARDRLDLDAEFPPAFADDAALLGIYPERARQYWASHWQLPSYEQLAEMLFRGELSSGEFADGLKAIDYAPTWRSKLETIARRIPTITDMVRFAVREVYDPAARRELGIDAEYPTAFTAQAAKHGMAEDDARDYWAAHWRLPSARQGYQMLWRGEIGEAELDLLLKALDYPPVWRDRLANIARLVPGRIDLKRMLRYEILDRDEVEAGYLRLGYAPLDAERMTQIAEAEVGSAAPGETYVNRARSSLFNRLRTEYVSRQLTSAEATAGLAAAGVPGAQRGRVLDLWTFERTAVRTELTQAQIVKANKKGEMSDAEALAELVERGMSAEDAGIRLRSG